MEEGEDHSHSDACVGKTLLCPLEEEEGHAHSDSCWENVMICQLEEGEDHTHDETCMQLQLTCPLEEKEGHVHDAGCFREDYVYICGKEATEGHTHTEECYTITDDGFICGLEEVQEHTHTEECYQEECSLAEHIHTANCYSDISADLETSDVWEDSLAGLIRSPSTAENIVTVARSQLGVEESVLNFHVDEFGVRRGITRYGQWYGNSYGDWSAMFASFCLHYAGVEDVPENAGAESLRLEWAQEQLYLPASEHTPLTGQLVFLDKDADGAADAVAIVEKLEENVIFAIEGNLRQQVTQIGTVKLYPEGTLVPEEAQTDRVMETLYALEDPAVMGYGIVPFAPGLMLLPNDDIAAYAATRTIWLDGTNGGIMSLGGSANTAYSAEEGTLFTLPEQWQSPEKYRYSLRGWYDVTNSRYYAPGAQVEVTGDMVFYADWAAATYDVGQFNSQVSNTVSTNDFVTVRMFDYGPLFNVLSERADVTVSSGGHTEIWNLLTSGNNSYNGAATLNYIFRDWDRGNEDISYPVGTNDRNDPTDAGSVYMGLFNSNLRNLLFDPGTEAIGKQYLGTGDYLFQLCEDPSHEHYGYYYYNSERNAASYNQSAQRFYVYDYLECTRTSAGSGNEGKYSDFLPLNSPYANTNGKTVNTYYYAGSEGEYNGTTHYMYDCRYNDSDNSTNNVATNFWFGMSVDISFYLPNVPGTTVPEGGYGNKDIYGKDMHFQFSGDDDVWVMVDDTLVLDLGGIHGMESGDINFSTGVVTINGVVNETLSNNLKSISAGEHTLRLYYLERGSSMSNCAIYFNLAPRFSFSIQKEDALTQNVLNGAQFSVYTDQACTIPAELWTSKAAHDRKEPSVNTFTVVNGAADMWGMGAGNTYYIKETKAPDNEDYEGIPNGVICLTFDKAGTANYQILDTGSGISGGFTVHGFRIDTETQQAYIVATNAPKWVQDTTSVQVRKQWQDQKNHNADSITVYLTVTDPNGTVRRIRETQLGSGNDWQYKWENLPEFWEDGSHIRYGVEEAYISGYYGKVEQVHAYTEWVQKNNFENGKTYLLRSANGYLSTASTDSDTGFIWVTENAAVNSPQAVWTASVTGQGVRLTNGSGQNLTFYYNGGSSGYPTDFFASTAGENDASKQYFRHQSGTDGLRLYYDGADGRDYYLVAAMTDAQKFQYSTNYWDALVITPMAREEIPVTEDVAYLVTNSPLEQETSLEVHKHWDYGYLETGTVHEQVQVTVKLLADGKDTGRTVTLNLKNGWRGYFQGLPYADENGKVISYTVEESWDTPDWIPHYDVVTASGTDIPHYTTSITNTYRWGIGGPELPSTGTAGRMMYTLCGSSIMLASLVYGFLLRRKRERRTQ